MVELIEVVIGLAFAVAALLVGVVFGWLLAGERKAKGYVDGLERVTAKLRGDYDDKAKLKEKELAEKCREEVAREIGLRENELNAKFEDERERLRVQEQKLKSMEAVLLKKSPIISSLTAIKARLDELRLKVSGQAEFKPISTEEHEQLMFDLLAKAQHDVLIISPWVTSNKLAVLEPHFDELVERRVAVRIGVSVNPYNLKNSDAGALFKLVSKTSEKFRVYGLDDIHYKLFITDDSDAIITSYNWLSRTGKRKERGVYFTNALMVQSEKQEYLKELKEGKNLRIITGTIEKLTDKGDSALVKISGTPREVNVWNPAYAEQMNNLKECAKNKQAIEVLASIYDSGTTKYLMHRTKQ